MQCKKLFFQNARGEKLAATLDVPISGKPRAYAILAHCFTCTKDLKANIHISRALSLRSIAVLRFDFTGLGNSEGEFPDTNFTTDLEDLIAASEFLAREYEAPRLLIGHSLGGTAALMIAGEIPSVQGVVTIGSPFDPWHVAHHFEEYHEAINQKGEAEVLLAGRKFTIKKQFMEDLKKYSAKETISQLKAALLVLHSPRDQTVDISNAAKIFQAAKHPKSYVTLEPADHLLSNNDDSYYAGEVIAAWANKFLGLNKQSVKRPSDNLVRVTTGGTGFYTEINVNQHSLVADEPVSIGGTDLGPTPYDLLASALGACTAMTIRMYADRKKWKLTEVNVQVKHEKTHARDCANCDEKPNQIDQFSREIEVVGDLSAAQKEKILEIANKCPVHRSLHAEVKVVTAIK
jgi:putative redox protein